MPDIIAGPWRRDFESLIGSTRSSLLIASPFIKLDEARRATTLLSDVRDSSSINLTVLTDFRADSVMSASLDIEALRLFASSFESSAIVSVPRLHAKVYVSDERTAIVTSANLTRSGMEGNVEYGVRFTEQKIVRQVVTDMTTYARLGSNVPLTVLDDLAQVERQLRAEYRTMLKSSRAAIQRRFDERYRTATEALIATQIGNRSANAVFSEAILYLLNSQPVATVDLHPAIKRLLPDLCDDDVELIINGERYGKRWKHQVRNAQQALKRAGLISFDGQRWARTRNQ